MTEEELVRRAQKGDQKAFDALVGRYWDKTYRLALSIVGPSDAEDVASSAFLQAWKSLSRFGLRSSFATWLYRITFNIAVRQKRKQAREEPMEEVEEGTEPSLWDIEEMASDREIKRLLHRLVQQLPEELRVPLVLRFWNDLSYEEIGQVLGVRESTARMRTAEALQRISDRWSQVFGETFGGRQRE